MALYLGNSEKLKLNMNNAVYLLNIFSRSSITNSIGLLSSENYILKSSDGLYLVVRGMNNYG